MEKQKVSDGTGCRILHSLRVFGLGWLRQIWDLGDHSRIQRFELELLGQESNPVAAGLGIESMRRVVFLETLRLAHQRRVLARPIGVKEFFLACLLQEDRGWRGM